MAGEQVRQSIRDNPAAAKRIIDSADNSLTDHLERVYREEVGNQGAVPADD